MKAFLSTARAGLGACILIVVASCSAYAQGAAPPIVIDDYVRQPNAGDANWFYNRLGGNRGTLAENAQSATVTWGQGSVTATIQQGSWAGVWNSLRHNTSERANEDALNLDAILPPQILAAYQVRVTGLRFQIAGGSGTFKAELKNALTNAVWAAEQALTGGPQTIEFTVPEGLGFRHELNWLVLGGSGNFVTVSTMEFLVTAPALTVPQRAFLYSFAMLLDNLAVRGPHAGLTRDRANFPSGDFDNVSAGAAQATAAVLAWHLGFMSAAAAEEIVTLTTNRLLALPTCHGLWPHFLQNGGISPNTEWSSVDSVFGLVALLAARTALGMSTSSVEQLLTGIDWTDLLLSNGSLSHGYQYAVAAPHCGTKLTSGWSDFGTESWLANLGYAAASERIAQMESMPPTFNGSGFIDELAWLLVRPPSSDRAGINWSSYRGGAVDVQAQYYPTYYPDHCYVTTGQFGLSAAEVPVPSAVALADIYQPFGVGGKGAAARDGNALMGQPIVTPHYTAMIAGLRPAAAETVWSWLIANSLITALTNVESLAAQSATDCAPRWNDLKGSWNLALQALGWGAALTTAANPIHRAAFDNALLRRGYALMAGDAFTDDPLIVGTAIGRVHVVELRARIDLLRARFNLSTIQWPEVVARVTTVDAGHLQQMRTALGDVYSEAGRTAPAYTDSTLHARTTVVQAVHFRELRTNVKLLEVEFP